MTGIIKRYISKSNCMLAQQIAMHDKNISAILIVKQWVYLVYQNYLKHFLLDAFISKKAIPLQSIYHIFQQLQDLNKYQYCTDNEISKPILFSKKII